MQARSIVMFVPYYPPYMGGIANHAEEFAEAFVADGKSKVTLVIPRFKGEAARKKPREGITLIEVPAFEWIPHVPFPKFWTKAYAEALSRLTPRDTDAVFSRTRFFASSWMAKRFARKHKLPWIHIEHGSSFVKVKNPFVTAGAWLYDQTLGRSLLNQADEVVCISSAVQRFVARFRKKPTPCITRGMDIAAYEAIAADDSFRQEHPGKVIVWWAGRMTRWKGVHALLEGMKSLPKELLGTMALGLIGDGEDRAWLESLSQGLPVTFLGEQPRERVIGLLKSGDVYVHCSQPGGGLSTSLLEGMVTRNAILATPHEGASEVVTSGKEGILLTETTPRAFAEALEALLKDPSQCGRYGASAHRTILARFSWDTIINQYRSLIETIHPTHVDSKD